MTFKSVNPVDGTLLAEIAGFTPGELEAALEESTQAATAWSITRIGAVTGMAG